MELWIFLLHLNQVKRHTGDYTVLTKFYVSDSRQVLDCLIVYMGA